MCCWTATIWASDLASPHPICRPGGRGGPGACCVYGWRDSALSEHHLVLFRPPSGAKAARRSTARRRPCQLARASAAARDTAAAAAVDSSRRALLAACLALSWGAPPLPVQAVTNEQLLFLEVKL